MWFSQKTDSLLDANTLLLRFCTLVHDSRDMAAVIEEIAGNAGLAGICRLLNSPPDKKIENHFLAFCSDQMLNASRIQRRAGQIVEALRLDAAVQTPAEGYTILGIPDAKGQKPRIAKSNPFPGLRTQEYRSLFWIMGSLLVVLMATTLVFEKTLLSGTFENAMPRKESTPRPRPFVTPLVADRTFNAAAHTRPQTQDAFKPAATTRFEQVAGDHADPDAPMAAPPPPTNEPMSQTPAILPPPAADATTPAEVENAPLQANPAPAGELAAVHSPPPAPEKAAAQKEPARAAGPAAPKPQAPSVRPAVQTPKAAPAASLGSTPARDAGPPPKRSSRAPTSPEPALQQRLEHFLEVYCATYASRDLERFVTFFAPGATEQGRSFQSVLPDYRKTFGGVKTMDYSLRMLSFAAEPTGAMNVKGRFQAHYELPQGERGSSSGLIEMKISEQAGDFLITTLDYTLD